uniref:C-type lectin domain-containing protein n=1 Tax=Periophthalmus magnuspinnatus TaxID=409849 RepID=A0A3B4A936_9GOBI
MASMFVLAMCRSLSRISLTRVCPTALCSPVRSYILYDEPRTWFEAQSFCREHHLDLATITNSADATLLSTDVTGTDFAWIGLFDDMTEWRWSDGNVDLSSTNFTNWDSWAPSEPDLTAVSRICVSINANGSWSDEMCDETNNCASRNNVSHLCRKICAFK